MGVIDGLREHKKRLTRQRITDVATELFIRHGFDAVRVAEIAAAAGVSEKTVYNYFPTKESLVFDRADELIAALLTAVRERPRGTTPTSAFVTVLKRDFMEIVEHLAGGEGAGGAVSRALTTGYELSAGLAAWAGMVQATPALQAAWGEHRYRLVAALTEQLADEFGIDPRDPEPAVVARALVSLMEVYYDSQSRHLAEAAPASDARSLAEEICRAVSADLDRGARLLDTGFWSINLMLEGRRTKDQIRLAAEAAENARRQVMSAMREAKRAWKDGMRAAAQAHGEAMRAAAQAQADATQAQADAMQAAAEAQGEDVRAATRAQAEEIRAAARAQAQDIRTQMQIIKAQAHAARTQSREDARAMREQARDLRRRGR